MPTRLVALGDALKKKHSSWGRFALTHVAVATLSVASTAAWGLGLGRLSVQSALGETLAAEIDIASITPEEAGTLRVRVATPDAYRATGVDYNPVLTSTRVELARRSDGRPYLRIASDRAVQEPFVDVILEITWAGGRLVREYTMLFDPPTLARPVPPAAVSTAPAIAPAPVETRPLVPAAPAVAAAPRAAAAAAPASAPARAATPSGVSAPAPKPAQVATERPPAATQYRVKPGDTLSRVAGMTKPAEVSLDQMLVGLYRSNPEAFVGDNMNRLKAGVVLQVPSKEALEAIPAGEAREVVAVQSADFSAYRERLAAGAAALPSAPEATRVAKGQVQAEVDDRKAAPAPSPDKLKLSKAASAGLEAQASKEAERKSEAARVAELQRNVEELKKLSDAAKPAATPAAVASAPSPAAPAVAIPTAAVPASVPASVAAPAQAKPSAPAAKPMVPPPPVEAEPPGLVEELMNSPLVLPVAGVLVALLGGLGLMRLRGRASKPKADTGFHESRLQPDSFFGASGGQRVDTRDATSSGSSMSYSLSQLDAIGDVDPVAEADVYLAYGRDLQAEEILKEALRSNPERLAIRLKLLEVYAKRRDIKGFEQLAIQLYAETKGEGEDWTKAQELGRLIDPDNPLYQPGGAPGELLGDFEGHPEPMNASTLPQTAQQSTIVGAHLATEPMDRGIVDTGPASGLDLDLDLDLGESPAPAVSPTAMEATQAMATTVEQAPLSMDVDLSLPEKSGEPAMASTELGELSFDLEDLGAPAAAPAAAASASETPASLDFDLSSIDLDLPQAEAAAPAGVEEIPSAAATPIEGEALDSLLLEEQSSGPLANAFDALEDEGDPLQRQLELAEEFRQIGDVEGARDVLTELLDKATGDVKDKAQAMLKELR